MIKSLICPFCNKKTLFRMNQDDIDHTFRYPAPCYLKHIDDCGKDITLYFDSQMRIARMSKGKDNCSKWKFCKELQSEILSKST